MQCNKHMLFGTPQCYAPHCRMSVSDDCISSNVRPLVSDTSFAMKRTPKQQMLEYMKNVPKMAPMHN